MIAVRPLLLVAPLLLAGCGSSAPSLPKLNMFGGGEASAPATTASIAAPAPPPATPEERAAQVGAVSARAVKCGYNFDPARLRANFLASEVQAGTPVEQIAKAERAYDTINGSVTKAIAGDGGYCSEGKTREIKGDLTRHLAGDFSPPPRKVAADDGGFFGSLTGGSRPEERLTADRMWDRNGEQIKRR